VTVNDMSLVIATGNDIIPVELLVFLFLVFQRCLNE